MKVRVIVNRSGGTLKRTEGDPAEQLHAAFATVGVDADIHLTEPDDLSDALREGAHAPGLDALVAGGGDGTLSCAAGHLAGTGRPLGILPLGTLNHLARDAGIPSDIEQAAAVIAAGHVRAIDLAEVNGRVFVNNSSVGLYPDMVRLREAEQERKGRSKRLAMLSASLAALRHFRRYRLHISSDGPATKIHTPLMFVGNNSYQLDMLDLGEREALDGGGLCLYAFHTRSRLGMAWASLRGVCGALDPQDIMTTFAPQLNVASKRKQLIISVDGETVRMETPLRYRIRPKALNIIVRASGYSIPVS